MSAAPVELVVIPPENSDAEKLERMQQLVAYLVAEGACGICARSAAIAQTERELGDATYRDTPWKCTKVSRRTGLTCREQMVRAWKKRPDLDRRDARPMHCGPLPPHRARPAIVK